MSQHSILAAVVNDRGLQALALLVIWETLLLGSAWLIASLLRRASSAVRYCVWQYALLGLLAAPAAFALLPGVPLGISLTVADPPSGSAQRIGEAGHDIASSGFSSQADVRLRLTDDLPNGPMREIRPEQAPSKVRIPRVAIENQGNASTMADSANKAEAPRVAWSTGLVGGWILGVAAQLGWLLWRMGRARRLVRAAEKVDDARILGIERELASRFSRGRGVRLMKSREIRGPLLAGVRRPTILLPDNCAGWSDEKLRIVLSHELAHVERRDVLWQLGARAAAAVYWFHPLAWLALRRMRQERERACDDRVLSLGVPPADYAAGLAEFAAAMVGRPSPLVGSLGMAEQLPLEDRVRSILNASLSRHPASRRVRGVLLASVTCLVLVAGSLRPFTAAPRAAADPPQAREKVKAIEGAKSESKPAAKPTPPAAPRPKVVETTGNMRIKVIDPDGRPVAKAWIYRSVWTDEKFKPSREYTTDDAGIVEVDLPKTLTILRIWAGYVPLFAQWWPQHQDHGFPIPREFTFPLAKGSVIGGVVKNDDGEPIKWAKVEVDLVDRGDDLYHDERPIDDMTLAYGDAARITDADGRWTLDNVPPGKETQVEVKVSHPDYIDDRELSETQRSRNVTMAELRAETAVFILHRGAVLTGTVSDADGHPVKDAVVIWGDDPYSRQGSQEVHTDENGAYRFPPLPAGPLHVTVVAQGWMPERTETTLAPHPDTEALNFRLKPGKKLRIRFVDPSGATVPGVSARIEKWQGAESLYNDQHSNVLDTKIPRVSDENGVLQWNWAPDSRVDFRFNRKGFAETKAGFTADGSEQIITLQPRLRFVGTVIDAETGQPIEQAAAVPILHFRRNFPSVERHESVPCRGGKFETEFARADAKHSVQIEAPGYATVRSDVYAVGAKVPLFEIRMQPAPRFVGIVRDESERPVANARVYVGSSSERLHLRELRTDSGGYSANYHVTTNERGEFEIAHQIERYALTVVSDAGYGGAHRSSGELPGVLRVRPWAKLLGKLVQAGKPVPKVEVRLAPILDDQDAACGNAFFSATTDLDGSFFFDRVPPVACSVEGALDWSDDGPLRSSRSLPIAPNPGEWVAVLLGAGGAEVTGKLALDPSPANFDYHVGSNYLVALRPGVSPPPAVAAKGFDWRHGWSDAWIHTQEGRAYRDTLEHFFVKPEPDGRFRISGVGPGEYDLASHLYGSAEGSLVHPAGVAVVRVTVPEGRQAVDLGTIKVPAVSLLKVGDAAPEFDFTDLDGAQHKLADFRGQHVLIDFWSTWCGACVAKMAEVESLRRKYADQPGLVVLGANLDQDIARTEEFLHERKLPWQHTLLGDWSSTDVPKHFAISTVPTYVLVGPDGQILAHESSLRQIAEILEKAAKR